MGYVDIVSEDRFLQVAYAMLILASVFVLVRAGGQAWMRKPLEPPDYCLYSAYVFYLAMSICYIIIMPQIYRLGEAMDGKIPPWPTLAQDVVLCVRMMFITTTLFWGTLWSVKLSFLALYKNLMAGLPEIYMGMWWAVSIFCIVSLFGCIFSYLTSCAHFAATIHGEVCSGDRSLRGELASLYLTYALDVVTDLLIIILPMRLAWKLQRAWADKFSVLGLFASGFVIIAFATIRVAQIGAKARGSASPAPTWLALWSIIESFIAICVGCCPAFAFFYRTFNGSRSPHVSYDEPGYVRQDLNHKFDVEMNISAAKKAKISKKGPYWHDPDSSSLEELAADSKSIRVTTVLRLDHR